MSGVSLQMFSRLLVLSSRAGLRLSPIFSHTGPVLRLTTSAPLLIDNRVKDSSDNFKYEKEVYNGTVIVNSRAYKFYVKEPEGEPKYVKVVEHCDGITRSDSMWINVSDLNDFIKHVKLAQDCGEAGPVTLSEESFKFDQTLTRNGKTIKVTKERTDGRVSFIHLARDNLEDILFKFTYIDDKFNEKK